MILVSETMTGQIVEVGERPGGGHEFIVEVEDGDESLRIPCTAPVAREAGAHLYIPMKITFTMIAREPPEAAGA